MPVLILTADSFGVEAGTGPRREEWWLGRLYILVCRLCLLRRALHQCTTPLEGGWCRCRCRGAVHQRLHRVLHRLFGCNNNDLSAVHRSRAPWCTRLLFDAVHQRRFGAVVSYETISIVVHQGGISGRYFPSSHGRQSAFPPSVDPVALRRRSEAGHQGMPEG